MIFIIEYIMFLEIYTDYELTWSALEFNLIIFSINVNPGFPYLRTVSSYPRLSKILLAVEASTILRVPTRLSRLTNETVNSQFFSLIMLSGLYKIPMPNCYCFILR